MGIRNRLDELPTTTAIGIIISIMAYIIRVHRPAMRWSRLRLGYASGFCPLATTG